MTRVDQLLTIADLDRLMAASVERPVLIFKHSTACGISARAHDQWESFLQSPEAAAVSHALVRVIEERPVSQAIAARVGVQHESPQALLIKAGQAVWHDSHRAITAKALAAAVTEQTGLANG